MRVLCTKERLPLHGAEAVWHDDTDIKKCTISAHSGYYLSNDDIQICTQKNSIWPLCHAQLLVYLGNIWLTMGLLITNGMLETFINGDEDDDCYIIANNNLFELRLQNQLYSRQYFSLHHAPTVVNGYTITMNMMPDVLDTNGTQGIYISYLWLRN